MSSHTPAPWTFSHGSVRHGAHEVAFVRQNINPQVALANAAVITAAPDLLEALVALVFAVQTTSRPSGDDALPLAIAAIDKAEGRA
jgi:hypothetical protein